MTELNKVEWSGRTGKRHYEGWYITLVDPKTGCALWCRYTLFVPEEGVAKASVWAFSFDPDDAENCLQGRDDYPLTAFTKDAKSFKINIGETAELKQRAAKGSVGTAKGPISWDLTWTPSRVSWEHFNPALFKAGVSQTCVNSEFLNSQLSGTVTFGGRTLKLSGVPGEQSHIWGRRPTPYYAWAHCNAFEGRPEVTFEGLSARIEKGLLRLPLAGPLLLVTDTHRFEVKSFLKLFGVKSDQDYGRWAFECESDGLLLSGEVRVPPERVVVVEYDDPAGQQRAYCHNSLLADMSLKLYERQGGLWRKCDELHSRRTTAFEITRKAPDPRVSRKLDLADGVAHGF